jgi:hypothetical protein
MTDQTCSAGNQPDLCCLPGAWGRLHKMGPMAFYLHGEPLPEPVADIAAGRGIDPHTLDHHVEGVHGWEPHDVGYPSRVGEAADCLASGGCE